VTKENFSIFVEFKDASKSAEDLAHMTLFPYAVDKMHTRKGTAISYRFKRTLSCPSPSRHDSLGDPVVAPSSPRASLRAATAITATSSGTTGSTGTASRSPSALSFGEDSTTNSAVEPDDHKDTDDDDTTAECDTVGDDDTTVESESDAAPDTSASGSASGSAANKTAAGSMSDSANELTWDEVDGRKRIMTGTLRGLVCALADQDVQDKDFLDVFVMTYRYFTTPAALFDELANRFCLLPAPGQANDELFARSKNFVQMRVINVLKKWLQCHFRDVAASDESRHALSAALARMAAASSDSSRGFVRHAAQMFDELWREWCEERGLATPLDSIVNFELESPRVPASPRILPLNLAASADRPLSLAPPSPRTLTRASSMQKAPTSPRLRPTGAAPSSPRLSHVANDGSVSPVSESPPRRKRRSAIKTASGATLGRPASSKGSPLIGGSPSARRQSLQDGSHGGSDDPADGSSSAAARADDSDNESDVNDKSSSVSAEVVSALLFPAAAPAPDTTARFSIDDFSATQLAHQMTLDEFRIFARIDPTRELSLKTWEKRPEDAPNIGALIERINDISWWTATEVIMKPTPKQRVDVVCKMIDAAQILRDLNNFNGLMELTSGLNLSVVTRLKQLWESVPKKKVEQLRALSDIMSPLSGYANYRRELAKVDGASGGAICSAIPFQGVYLSNLIAIDENPNVLANGHINFAKMWMVGRIFRSIVAFQRIPYDLQPDDDVGKFFRSIAKLNDDELWQLSLKLQPRTSSADEAAQPAVKDSFAKRLLTTRPRRNSLLGKAKKTDLETQLTDIEQSNEDEGVKELRKQMAMRDTPASRLVKAESSNRVRSNSVGHTAKESLLRAQSASNKQ
jgi:hypothetical protein